MPSVYTFGPNKVFGVLTDHHGVQYKVNKLAVTRDVFDVETYVFECSQVPAPPTHEELKKENTRLQELLIEARRRTEVLQGRLHNIRGTLDGDDD